MELTFFILKDSSVIKAMMLLLLIDCFEFSVSVFAVQTGVAKTGGFRYDDSTRYIGDWNQKGQKHGMGHLLLPDGTRYGEENLLW
jgi:hypothetical protein